MNIKSYIVDVTKHAAWEFFRNAKAVPADKLDWSPLGEGRSVLDLCREIAMTPVWGEHALGDTPMEWNEEIAAATKLEQSAWLTAEDCERVFQERFERLAGIIVDFPDEKLTATKWLPYDGGRDFTFLELLGYARWNLDYHAGQVSYIQILYGDHDMH
jgi:hypothetical protein